MIFVPGVPELSARIMRWRFQRNGEVLCKEVNCVQNQVVSIRRNVPAGTLLDFVSSFVSMQGMQAPNDVGSIGANINSVPAGTLL